MPGETGPITATCSITWKPACSARWSSSDGKHEKSSISAQQACRGGGNAGVGACERRGPGAVESGNDAGHGSWLDGGQGPWFDARKTRGRQSSGGARGARQHVLWGKGATVRVGRMGRLNYT